MFSGIRNFATTRFHELFTIKHGIPSHHNHHGSSQTVTDCHGPSQYSTNPIHPQSTSSERIAHIYNRPPLITIS